MDGKFLLLLLCSSATAFGGTWMLMRAPEAPKPHAPEFAAHDASGKILVFDNCEQVRAAGMAPLWAGKPGYTHKLDPQDSGIACTPM